MTSYYWCTEHKRVETDADKCPGYSVLGPYSTSDQATGAIKRIKDREERLDEEDAKWEGEQ